MTIQESIMGWRYLFTGALVGAPAEAPRPMTSSLDYAGIKAGTVTRQEPGAPAPVGVRYIPAVSIGKDVAVYVDARYEAIDPDPGTPATVVEAIQKSIGESAEGWRMGFAHVAGKVGGASAELKAGIEKSLAGWGMAAGIVGGEIKKGVGGIGSSVSGAFGDVGDWFKSMRYQMLIPILLIVFVIVLVAIGYSGLGGPAARVAEKEYGRRR